MHKTKSPPARKLSRNFIRLAPKHISDVTFSIGTLKICDAYKAMNIHIRGRVEWSTMNSKNSKLSKPSNKIILSIFVSLFVLTIISGIPKSYEHAFVIDSTPAPASSVNTVPAQIEIEFVDPIDLRYSQIKVLDSNGKTIQNNDWHFTNNEHTKTAVSLPPDTPNGIYTVYTKVLDATDGHTTTNAFVFAIGQPIPQNLLNAKTNISFADMYQSPMQLQDTQHLLDKSLL